jgi:hypothetical protein
VELTPGAIDFLWKAWSLLCDHGSCLLLAVYQALLLLRNEFKREEILVAVTVVA